MAGPEVDLRVGHVTRVALADEELPAGPQRHTAPPEYGRQCVEHPLDPVRSQSTMGSISTEYDVPWCTEVTYWQCRQSLRRVIDVGMTSSITALTNAPASATHPASEVQRPTGESRRAASPSPTEKQVTACHRSRSNACRAQRGFTGHMLQIASSTISWSGVGSTTLGGATVSVGGRLPA